MKTLSAIAGITLACIIVAMAFTIEWIITEVVR